MAGAGSLGTRQMGHARALHAVKWHRQPFRAPGGATNTATNTHTVTNTSANASANAIAATNVDAPFLGRCRNVNDSTFSDALRLLLQPARIHRHDIRCAWPQHAAAEFGVRGMAPFFGVWGLDK